MNQHWSTDAVIYHIYTLSLAQADFHNDYAEQKHSFLEIEKWLPHIKGLGCNAVLFSPVLKSCTHGYDVTDYLQIDNRIGTNAEFTALVKLFHDKGVRVILDSVFNHCGRDFFAFQELRNGNKEYADWFSGVDFSKTSPLGDFFTYDTWGGYYELPKFNLKNEDVQRYLLDAAKYWIDTFDIDGMRLDAADELDFGFMKKLRTVTTASNPDFWLMGEVVHGDYARWVNTDTLHSVTNYTLFKSLFSSHNDNNLYELAYNLQHAVPLQGLPLYNFLDNHDQPRIASNVHKPEFLGTLHTLLFTLPGIPSIYYGSEWGIQGKKENNSDQPLRPYINIENPPKNVPWLESYIRRLADIRQEQTALKHGGYRQVYLEYHKPLVFERRYDNERIYVAVNIGTYQEHINLTEQHHGNFFDLLSGEHIHHHATHSIPIAPYSSRILKVE
jgi:glycosidase